MYLKPSLLALDVAYVRFLDVDRDPSVVCELTSSGLHGPRGMQSASICIQNCLLLLREDGLLAVFLVELVARGLLRAPAHVVVAEYGSLELMQGFPLITELVQVLALSDRHLEVVQSCVHFHLVLCCRSDVHLLAAGPRDVDHDFVFVGLPGADL